MALTVQSSRPVGSRDGQVFWTGQDGNVWLRAADGTTSNMGSPQQAQSWNYILNGATEIGDPNPGNVQTAPTGGGDNGLYSTAAAGPAAPTYKDTTAARNATDVSINSLDTIFNNALTGADEEYTGVTGAYDVEDAANLTRYKGDVEKNEITRDGNTQASLLGAARGSRGLYATLASLGALNGTGRQVANRAVATEANADLGAGEKSFETNVESLFNTRSEVEKKEKQRRLDAEKTWKDTKQSAEFDYLKGNQDLSREMASLWTDAGNFGEANNWTNRASTYTPRMAEKTKVNPAKYAKDPLAYSTPEMANYLAGQSSTAVNVAGGSPINGALYTSTKKRDELV